MLVVLVVVTMAVRPSSTDSEQCTGAVETLTGAGHALATTHISAMCSMIAVVEMAGVRVR